MISTLRLLSIWLRGGIPSLSRYEAKNARKAEKAIKKSSQVAAKAAWDLVFDADFAASAPALDTKNWILARRKSGLEGLYGQFDQYDVPLEENVTVDERGLCLKACPAEAKGLQWHKDYGFMPVQAEYGGAYVAATHDLSSKKGRIVCRIRWEESDDFLLTAALESKAQLPMIQFFTLSRYWQFGFQNKHYKKMVCLPKSLLKEGELYEFELAWAGSTIRWRVNGMEVLRVYKKLPKGMYFSAGISLSRKIQAIRTCKFRFEQFRVYARHTHKNA